ncbi:Coatomer subunit gamma [Seminavis robusta]|uniref:Coatomer subunit gamma n=1 Tax=Seminavis robusta TaxID=568900 RepID=A0A9N8E196_9STRA|nr:Coatomer subunit gamma [Seminavis robusta]|eukprot:Sro458_g147120.1 Coatomer subunit gamma (485) ;mRNA; r:38173-39627
MYAYDTDSDDSSAVEHRRSSAYNKNTPATTTTTTPRYKNVCTTVMSALTGGAYKTESERRLETKDKEKEERDKVSQYISFDIPYVWVKKSLVLQESQIFHDAYPHPLFCLAVLGRLLRLHSKQQLVLEPNEVTDLFFGVTKLFGSSTVASPMDQYVRRLVYWLLSEITEISQPEERMMLLSCLTKDMTDQFTPALRSRALRLLPCVLIRKTTTTQSDNNNKQQESSNILKLSQTIAATKTIATVLPCSLDPESMAVSSRVMSGALVALCHLLQHEQSSSLISSDDEEVLQTQCYVLAKATTSNKVPRDLRMVQLHAMITATALDQKQQNLYQDDGSNMENYAPSHQAIKLMGDVIQGGSLHRASPLTWVMLLRHTEQVMLTSSKDVTAKENGDHEGATNSTICATHYHFFLQSSLINPSEMVILEAARVVINLAPKHVPLDMMEHAVKVLNRIQKTSSRIQNKTAGRTANKLLAEVGKKLVLTL